MSSNLHKVTADTLIVGAGLGGLAAAIRLAAAGKRVTLVEKNERVGGKLNLVQADGYTFDTGPSLLTMPWVVEDLFTVAGRRMEDYLTLEQVEPTCRYVWSDGTVFNAWQRLPQLIQEIERLHPPDVAGFFRFMAYASQIYDSVADTFLLKPFAGLRELINPRLMLNGPKIDALRSVDAAVRSFFQSRYLRQVFNRYTTYNGSSPYISPATFNVIAYIEMAEGGWYVRGGMHELGRALARLAAELGIELRLQTEVDTVLVENGIARGIRTTTGEQLTAERVILNADPRYVYAGVDGTPALLPSYPRRTTQMQKLEPSCSGFILFLGIDRQYEQLAHHNIFFSDDYRREFDSIFQKGVPAVDPTVYVATTCRSDPQHAPSGHMNLFVLVNAPSLGTRVNWERESDAYRDLVLTKLERMGLTDLRRHIRYTQTWTPADIEHHFYAARGAIYGLSSNNPFSAFLRPPLRSPDVERLYFVGGGTHPGGGIPLVLLSGRAVAERVLQE